MKRLSIGVRLTVWYVAIFALGQFVFGVTMFFVLQHNVYDLVDDDLESQVGDLKNLLATQKNAPSLDKLKEVIAETYGIEHSGDFMELYSESGDLLYRSSFLQAHPSILLPPDQVKRRIIRSRKADGQYFRFIFQKLTVNDHVYTVEMGASSDDAVETLNLFRSSLLMFAPLLLLVAAGFGYWMSRRALAPVDVLVRTARDVSGANLKSRLPKLNTGDELQRLSDTLNEMLDRIESAFLRVTQFTADASHELRTPIALIRTDAELALRRSRAEGEYRESLQHILLEAERTTALIEQLLELARADCGQEVLHLEPVNLYQTITAVSDAWQQVAKLRGLQLTSSVGDRTAFVLGDETMLRRLVDVLLDNAFKYTPSPGSVRLSLEEREQHAVILVQDSGVGIAKDDQSKIFERFYRVDKARSRAEGGTGLGLSIARWIVGQHHGSISVQSDLGQGSTFRVELPMIASPVQNPQPV